MTIAGTADRLVQPLPADHGTIWVDRDARRWPPGTILRICEPEAIDHTGDLRPAASYELVVVMEVVSPYRLHIARGQFGTEARSYAPGSLVDSIATSPMGKDRPVYHGFEDL